MRAVNCLDGDPIHHRTLAGEAINRFRILGDIMGYREQYLDRFSLSGDLSRYDIHHIDLNHKNDSMDNLLLLPKGLHNSYHLRIPNMDNLGFTIYPKSVIDGGTNYNDYNMKNLESFISVWRQVSMWLDYKNFLLGIIPNIHNLTIEGAE